MRRNSTKNNQGLDGIRHQQKNNQDDLVAMEVERNGGANRGRRGTDASLTPGGGANQRPESASSNKNTSKASFKGSINGREVVDHRGDYQEVLSHSN